MDKFIAQRNKVTYNLILYFYKGSKSPRDEKTFLFTYLSANKYVVSRAF